MSDKNKKLSSTVKGMNDEDIVEQHAKLGREKHAPTEGFLIAPLVFVFVFGCLIFVCSIQLAHSTNSFNVNPPKEVVVKTDEEIEEERFATKLALGKKGFDPLMGARPMSRLIQDTIRKALADELLFGRLVSGGAVHVDIDDQDKIILSFPSNKSSKQKDLAAETE